MSRTARKTVLGMVCLALILAWALGRAGMPSARAQEAAPATPPPAPPKAGDIYKNIQVLKDVPADQMIPTMEFFAASLGVDCDHCHFRPTWDREGKVGKVMARIMIQMVAGINKANFGGSRTVTCYTCHRASLKTVGTPMVASEQPRPVWPAPEEKKETQPAAALAAPPAAEQLFEKYLAALGGPGALQKVSSRIIHATVTDFVGEKAPAEISFKAPDTRLRNVHLKEGDNITCYNGGKGWIRELNRPAYPMGKADLDAARLEDGFYFAERWKQLFSGLKVNDKLESVDGHEAYVVEGRTAIFPLVKIYFDKESGLLLRQESYYETWVGRFYTRTDFADYRDVDGLKIPFHWTTSKIRGVLFSYQIDRMERNVPIDDARFVMPVAPPRPSAPPPAQ